MKTKARPGALLLPVPPVRRHRPILADIKQLVGRGLHPGAPVAEFEEQLRPAHRDQVRRRRRLRHRRPAAFAQGPRSRRRATRSSRCANTFVATAGAIATAGARVVFVDCDDKFVIDRLQDRAPPSPRAPRPCCPSHWGGQPADMGRIMKIAAPSTDAGPGRRLPVHRRRDRRPKVRLLGRRRGLQPAIRLKNINVWGDGGLITTDSGSCATPCVLCATTACRAATSTPSLHTTAA